MHLPLTTCPSPGCARAHAPIEGVHGASRPLNYSGVKTYVTMKPIHLPEKVVFEEPDIQHNKLEFELQQVFVKHLLYAKFCAVLP